MQVFSAWHVPRVDGTGGQLPTYLPGLQQRVTSPLAFTTLQLCLNIITYLCRSAAHITSSSQKRRSLVIMMQEESHALTMLDWVKV